MNPVPSPNQSILALDVVHSARYFHDHGRCDSFRPSHTSVKPVPGEQHGYKFLFGLTTEDMLQGGFDIFVHDPEEWWSGEH